MSLFAFLWDVCLKFSIKTSEMCVCVGGGALLHEDAWIVETRQSRVQLLQRKVEIYLPFNLWSL